MVLQVNDTWRITTDAMNVTVEKQFIAGEDAKNNPGEPYWKAQAYFGTVPQAATWLVNQHVRDFDGSDVDKLVGELNRLYAQIEQACKMPSLV